MYSMYHTQPVHNDPLGDIVLRTVNEIQILAALSSCFLKAERFTVQRVVASQLVSNLGLVQF